jgi:hypothetical protein
MSKLRRVQEWIKSETLAGRGFQNMVDLAGRISNRFLGDIGAIARLQVV